MPEEYYPPIDPGGAQKASTAASALGFVALVGSGAGATMEGALGLGAPNVAVAGISLASWGSESLFCIGLVLVGAGILLNIISLELHRRVRNDYQLREEAKKQKKE